MYPKEMELCPDPEDRNHFGIRPVENVDVEPAKFRQVRTVKDWNVLQQGCGPGFYADDKQ